MIVFAKGANQSLDLLCDAGYDVIGLDWTISPASAREIVKKSGRKITLQGNLDPSLLYADHITLTREVQQMFDGPEGFGRSGCHIANLGHGKLLLRVLFWDIQSCRTLDLMWRNCRHHTRSRSRDHALFSRKRAFE